MTQTLLVDTYIMTELDKYVTADNILYMSGIFITV
jgi:hypothetical protein